MGQEQNILAILCYLKSRKGFDFEGYRSAMIERRIQKRIRATHCKSFASYLDYLHANAEEAEKLRDVFTINVSEFFRDPLLFEYLYTVIMPAILSTKVNEQDKTLRIWSAGCARGEEAYSTAILVHELLSKDSLNIKPSIFATDIDTKALQFAADGVYSEKRLENIKLAWFRKYFRESDMGYIINALIRQMLQFSSYNLLDDKASVPPESLYGSFDLVLCRNVLIYFQQKQQDYIFQKLWKSLKPGGYLILGETELMSRTYLPLFSKVPCHCKIYQKMNH